MKTIAVLNEKGGAGKTTIATNVARALQKRGHRVALIDTDAQGTARDWAAASEDTSLLPVYGIEQATLEREVPRLADAFDYCIIDGAAKASRTSVSAMKAADLVVIPVQPSAADVWAAQTLVELVKERREIAGRPAAAFVVTRVTQGTRLAQEAREALEALGLPVLEAHTVQRVAYAKAVERGLGVVDLEDEKARTEIEAITDELLALLP